MVNSIAGFVTVSDEGRVSQCPTDAPLFIDLEEIEEQDIDRISGNYVRVRIEVEGEREVVTFKDMLVNEMCAAAALVLPVRKDKTVTRAVTPKTSLDRLEDSITHFIKGSSEIDTALKDEVNNEVLKTLAEIDNAI